MELNGDYLSHIPTAVPAGKILVHNDIWPPVRRIGTKRFRIWFATPSDRFEKCPCGWAPELPEHYRMIRAEASHRERSARSLRPQGLSALDAVRACVYA